MPSLSQCRDCLDSVLVCTGTNVRREDHSKCSLLRCQQTANEDWQQHFRTKHSQVSRVMCMNCSVADRGDHHSLDDTDTAPHTEIHVYSVIQADWDQHVTVCSRLTGLCRIACVM